MITPASSRVVVIAFVQDGCGACDEFKPVLDKVSKEFGHVIATVKLDAGDPEAGQLAEKYNLDGTPTLLALKRGDVRHAKLEGAADLAETRRFYDVVHGWGRAR